MRFEIRFTKLACGDLKCIQKYIFKDNKDAAKAVVCHILNIIENVLPKNPGAGRAGRVFGTRELVISKYPYIVPYQVKGNCIYILRILHTSKKWEDAVL